MFIETPTSSDDIRALACNANEPDAAAADISHLDHDHHLGEALMDAEHGELIVEMQRLLAAGTDAEAEKAMASFVDVWRRHCEDEESLMAAVNYPGLAQHRDSHRQFDGLLLYNLSYYLLNQQWGSHEMAAFVSRWFRGHLEGFDRPLADFVKVRHA